MLYLLLALFMALVLGLCWCVDRLLKKLFPKDARQLSGKAVRLPRRTSIFGVVLTFFAVVLEVNTAFRLEWYLHLAAVAVLILGVWLLVQFFSFSIYYDQEGFTYRNLGRKPMDFRYGDILGQRSLLTRSGVNSTLYLSGDEIPIYSAMQGAGDFLQCAFYRWCEATGTDPETVENNPQYLTWFPEPPKE